MSEFFENGDPDELFGLHMPRWLHVAEMTRHNKLSDHTSISAFQALGQAQRAGNSERESEIKLRILRTLTRQRLAALENARKIYFEHFRPQENLPGYDCPRTNLLEAFAPATVALAVALRAVRLMLTETGADEPAWLIDAMHERNRAVSLLEKHGLRFRVSDDHGRQLLGEIEDRGRAYGRY